jgi:hypothetical protein
MQLMAVVRATGEGQAEFERVFTEVNRLLRPVGDVAHSRWAQLMRMVIGYALFRRPAAEHPRIREIVERENAALVEEVRGMEKTIAQAIEERAARQATLEHARTTLQLQLKARGFSLPESLVQQIAACDDRQRLDAALIRVVQVKSIDEFSL